MPFDVGFLQADPSGAPAAVPETLELEMATHNVRLAWDSRRFCNWIEATYGGRCYFLPNLYYSAPVDKQSNFCGSSTLRIGIFGAVRPQKI